MRLIAAAVGARGSLQRRLVANLVMALVAVLVFASVVLVYEFYEHLEERAEGALRIEALEVADALDPAAPDFGQDPTAARFAGDRGAFRYTVFDADWRPRLGGELGPAAAAELAAAAATGGMIPIGPDRLGVVVTRELPGGPVHVLASSALFTADRADLAALRHELDEEIGWAILAILLVLVAAIVAARRALRPLRDALEQAGGIAPGAPDRRLTGESLPAELLPLVAAVNRAFDRLERGYQAQRDFASNVAHEIRTPLAVLHSAVERVEDPALRGDVLADLREIDRLFEQLIDLARADALGGSAQRDVCMHELALGLAMEMSAGALRSGRTLAVTGAASAPARGHPGLLSVALNNLVRNALAHAPKGSEIEIEVMADPPGWRVLDRGPGTPPELREALFERFRRGLRESAGPGGSGIGLAIVKAVAEGHGGGAGVEDRPGGGAVFTIWIPPPPPRGL